MSEPGPIIRTLPAGTLRRIDHRPAESTAGVMPGTTQSRLNRTRAEPSPLYACAPARTCLAVAVLLAGLSLGCAVDSPTAPRRPPPPPTGAGDSVVVENLNAGTTSWRVSVLAPAESLALWASPYAALPGDTLTIFLRSVKAALTLEIYRLGWYGGTGGRLMARETVPLATGQYPCSAPFPGPITCDWVPTLRIPLGQDWTGGLYLVRAQAPNGWSTSYPFVIRSKLPHAFLAVIPQMTWQAYNNWGGSSFYTIDPGTGADVPVVSFRRPFSGDASLAQMGGSADLATIRWLEQSGLDIGYVSDVDLADPSRPPVDPASRLIFIGHTEYWTQYEFTDVLQRRDAGHDLAFLGSNNAYWAVRFGADPISQEPSQFVYCYKSSILVDWGATSPALTTGRFRDAAIHRPENSLYGIMYATLLPAGGSPLYVAADDSTQGPEARSFLSQAGMVAGESLGLLGGAEGDGVVDNGFTPSNLQFLFTADQQLANGAHQQFHSAFFIAPSGAGVFATGTNRWTARLDGATALPAVQQVTAAVLGWMQAH